MDQCKLRQLLLILFLFASSGWSAETGIQGDREILRLIFESHKDNFSRLRTWQGDARIDYSVQKDNVCTSSFRSTAHFAVDQDRNAICWLLSVNERFPSQEGKPTMPPYLNGGMLKGEAYYHSFPGQGTKDGQYYTSIVIWPKEEYKAPGTDEDFNPLVYLRAPIYDSTYSALMYWYNWNESTMDGVLKIGHSGDIVSIKRRYQTPQMGDLLFEYEFDLSKGASMTLRHSYAPDIGHENIDSYTFQEVDGIWVPNSYVHENKSFGEGKTFRVKQKKISFTMNIVNKPVPTEEFELQALGAVPGTRVSDRIKGVGYVYHGFIADVFDADVPLESIAMDNNNLGPNVLGEVNEVTINNDPNFKKVLTSDIKKYTVETGNRIGWMIGVSVIFIALLVVYGLRKGRRDS